MCAYRQPARTAAGQDQTERASAEKTREARQIFAHPPRADGNAGRHCTRTQKTRRAGSKRRRRGMQQDQRLARGDRRFFRSQMRALDRRKFRRRLRIS